VSTPSAARTGLKRRCEGIVEVGRLCQRLTLLHGYPRFGHP
jgi:hypothetical protein